MSPSAPRQAKVGTLRISPSGKPLVNHRKPDRSSPRYRPYRPNGPRSQIQRSLKERTRPAVRDPFADGEETGERSGPRARRNRPLVGFCGLTAPLDVRLSLPARLRRAIAFRLRARGLVQASPPSPLMLRCSALDHLRTQRGQHLLRRARPVLRGATRPDGSYDPVVRDQVRVETPEISSRLTTRRASGGQAPFPIDIFTLAVGRIHLLVDTGGRNPVRLRGRPESLWSRRRCGKSAQVG